MENLDPSYHQGKAQVESIHDSELPNCILAAAAKLLQSCLTLRDPMDCLLPGSSVHGIFQARVLEWGAIAFPKLHP